MITAAKSSQLLSRQELWRFKKDFPRGVDCDAAKDPLLKTLQHERGVGEERAKTEVDWSDCPLAAAYPKLDERVKQKKRLRAAGVGVDSSTGGPVGFRNIVSRFNARKK